MVPEQSGVKPIVTVRTLPLGEAHTKIYPQN